MLVHLQLFLRFFHGGRALGVFILCYQKGSFGRVCIIAFLFSETVRVGVLERRPFRQTQKLSSFRKVGTAFLTSAPASCYLFCVWKKITKPLDSKSTVSIGFLWLGDHHVVASDGLDWTGLEARFHSQIVDMLSASAIIKRIARSYYIEAALAHLGERQTEVHFKSRITCEFWRYCVRSTEAASYYLLLLLRRREA
jgi:hypothetical protein